jgi:competence protein ComEC
MRCALLAFAAGIAGLQTRAALPALAWCASLAAIAALLALALIWGPAQPPASGPAPSRLHCLRLLRLLLSMACAALAGFVWAAFCGHQHLRDRLPPEWEGRDIELVGTIENLPLASEHGRRFLFAVEQVLAQDGVTPPVPKRLLLSWYAGRAGAAAVPEIAPGARWRFTVRLTRPHGNANPDGFDYELWLLERRIGATGYVRAGPGTPARRLDAFAFSVPHAIERARAYLRRKILAALPDAPHAGVIVALVIGEQRAIAKADWEVFRRTGVSHLIAISGLHIMMVAGLCGRLTQALWRRSLWLPERFATPLPLRLPAQKAALPAALLGAAAYAALAGFGIPAQRALYMLAAMALSFWLGRTGSPSHILCMALAAVLALDPWALLWPGFHLSFAAVAIIMYAGAGRTIMRAQDGGAARDGRLRRWLRLRIARGLSDGSRTQWAVTLGLLPLTMLLFAQYSLAAPLANALAIPAVTLLAAPLALLGGALPEPLASWALNAAHGVFSCLFYWLEWLGALPAAVWRAPLPDWPLFVTALAGALLMLAPRGWPLRWVGLFGWLPLLLNAPSHPPAGAMRVTAFDVGQGMALLLETERHRLLYDTGPRYGAEADAGARVILPYLQARGIDRLDALVISHGDNDHAGGALTLLHALPVTAVYSSLPAASRIIETATRRSRHMRCVGGQRWEWDGVTFEMLHPSAAAYAGGKWSANARSCTLKASAGALSILLPGDIGVAQEKELLAGIGAERLRATVLLAPHHGSKTSSSVDFLRAVDPELAIFQTGYRNRFHHPQATVYRRYHELGIHRLRTDEHGAITLQFGTVLQYRSWRQQHARYWHSGPAP